MNLPNKFKFKWHGNRGDYIYEDGTVTSFDCGHEYKTYFPNASQLVESGEWTIAKDLDEPELVFPFTFQTNSRILYTAEDKMGRVVVSWDDFGSGKGAITYSYDEVKTAIKGGIWIVKSVGPSTPASEQEGLELSEAEGDYNPPKAPTRVLETLKISVDTSEVIRATEALKALEKAAIGAKAALDALFGEQVVTCEASPIDFSGFNLDAYQ